MRESGSTLITGLIPDSIVLRFHVFQETALAGEDSPASLATTDVIFPSVLAMRCPQMIFKAISTGELGAALATDPVKSVLMHNSNMLFEAGICRECVPTEFAAMIAMTLVNSANMDCECSFLRKARAATKTRKVPCTLVYGTNMCGATLFCCKGRTTAFATVVTSPLMNGPNVTCQLRARCKECSAVATLVRLAWFVNRCMFYLRHRRAETRVWLKTSRVKGKTVEGARRQSPGFSDSVLAHASGETRPGTREREHEN